jgi:hypothetical protein
MPKARPAAGRRPKVGSPLTTAVAGTRTGVQLNVPVQANQPALAVPMAAVPLGGPAAAVPPGPPSAPPNIAPLRREHRDKVTEIGVACPGLTHGSYGSGGRLPYSRGVTVLAEYASTRVTVASEVRSIHISSASTSTGLHPRPAVAIKCCGCECDRDPTLSSTDGVESTQP